MSAHNILIGAGCLMVAASGTVLFSAVFTPRPGRVVPRRAELVWRGPGGFDRSLARARFELINAGDMPVRILGVGQGCGSMSVDVNPAVLKPGGQGQVDVAARYAPVGESTLPIVLYTDSPVTPRVELRLRRIGGRRPPFLLGLASGTDLSFMGDPDPADHRTLFIHAAESGPRTKAPLFGNAPPFFRIELKEIDERPYTTPGTVDRIYTFEVSFAKMPDAGLRTGEISVVDPWDDREVDSIRYVVDFNPPARVVPPLVVLRRQSSGTDASGRFRVFSRRDLNGLRFEEGSGEARPFFVTRVGPASASEACFEVRLPRGLADHVRSGRHIRLSWGDGSHIDVPVFVMGGTRS